MRITRNLVDLVDLNSVTHRTLNTTQPVHHPAPNREPVSHRFDLTGLQVIKSNNEKRYKHTAEKVQLVPELVHRE